MKIQFEDKSGFTRMEIYRSKENTLFIMIHGEEIELSHSEAVKFEGEITRIVNEIHLQERRSMPFWRRLFS